METVEQVYCRCVDPTPVFGNVTKVWYCYECGEDIGGDMDAEAGNTRRCRVCNCELVVDRDRYKYCDTEGCPRRLTMLLVYSDGSRSRVGMVR